MPLVSKTFSQIITFTRASSATYFDATGTLQSAAIDAPRFDYDPSTLAALGLLIEESRTNSIRNNTMVGAVAGTPGTAPTNWAVVAGGIGTLTQQVIGTGTSAGITYIDIRLSGTTSTNSVGYSFESSTQIVAAQNQVWTSTFWAALQGGSLTNINTVENRVIERDATGANLGSTVTDFKSSFTSSLARVTTTRTLASASAARVTNDIVISFSSGVAIDITLRIGLPQMEQGAFATSVIPTSTVAVTRAADVASVNTLSPWYNQTEGTVYAELQSLSPLTAAQSVALSKYPHLWSIEAGASDSYIFWYGVAAEAFISTTYNNIGVVPSGINKFALSLAPSGGQSRSSLNGAAAVNRSGTLTVTATGFFLGRDSTGGANNFLNGYLRRITYYPRALSSAELQTLTT